jgi:hypothetical protein
MSEHVKTGYTFKNYIVPQGEWGQLLTADDMRYTFLFGVDLTATNGQEATDAQLETVVDFAQAEFERYLGIDIRKRVRKTKPDSSLTRARYWREGVDYTDIEAPYDFDGDVWSTGFGFTQMRHRPIISIEAAKLYSAVETVVIDMENDDWVRLNEEYGQVWFYPKRGSGSLSHGPFLGGYGEVLSRFRGHYPQGVWVDYTTGYVNSDFVPDDLRYVVARLAAIGLLQWVGDGLLAGFSSSSISLDGLSESFSSTQSATSAYFGARIKSYHDEIKEWLKRNRYKYSNVPLAFA